MADQTRQETRPQNPAEAYQRFFVPAIAAPAAAELVRLADLRPGERVLDVGCGTGVVTRLAAERVGDDGAVAGLDINPAMLAVARSVTPAETSIEWHEASAESLPLPDDSFDVVLSQMSLQFVDDKPSALREMRRVLVPGGRMVVNVPGRETPVFGAMASAMQRHIGPEAAGFVHHVFSLHDPEELESLLSDAGFEDIATATPTASMRLPPAEEFLWQYVHSTPLAELVAGASEEARAGIERDVVGAWREFEEDGALLYEQPILVATARS